MNRVGTSQRGFTIVELLIVIVVIAILAAITIVAFNGIQSRAENTKTVSAVAAWVKALHSYKAEKGEYPTMNSCLGSPTTYTNAFDGRCWAPNTSSWSVQTNFLNAVAPYISSQPEPSNRNIHIDSDQYRGAIYYYAAAGDHRVYVNILGTTTCPEIGGLNTSYGGVDRTNGRSCYYRLP